MRMKHLIHIFILASLLVGCKGSQSNQNEDIAQDSTENKKSADIIYSKDSIFFSTAIPDYDEKDSIIGYNHNFYMKFNGKYHEVYELDFSRHHIFIYTDSTKSRYLYDKRGKYFLNDNEADNYMEFWFAVMRQFHTEQ